MIILFSDKNGIKNHLKNEKNKVYIKFRSGDKIFIDNNMLKMIKITIKNNTDLLQKIISSENNFIDYLTLLAKYQNK